MPTVYFFGFAVIFMVLFIMFFYDRIFHLEKREITESKTIKKIEAQRVEWTKYHKDTKKENRKIGKKTYHYAEYEWKTDEEHLFHKMFTTPDNIMSSAQKTETLSDKIDLYLTKRNVIVSEYIEKANNKKMTLFVVASIVLSVLLIIFAKNVLNIAF